MISFFRPSWKHEFHVIILFLAEKDLMKCYRNACGNLVHNQRQFFKKNLPLMKGYSVKSSPAKDPKICGNFWLKNWLIFGQKYNFRVKIFCCLPFTLEKRSVASSNTCHCCALLLSCGFRENRISLLLYTKVGLTLMDRIKQMHFKSDPQIEHNHTKSWQKK